MQALYDEAAETVRGMHNLHGMRDGTALEGIADFIGRAKHEAFIDPSIKLTTEQVRFNRRGEGETPQVRRALLEGHDDQGRKHARSERENPGEDPVRDETRRGRRSSGMCGSLGANKKTHEK
ncbi:hypothetical protein BKA62DRAFT_678046 [Auriculariales sp. MPI-PUGE-AT-0066]|nr:hypothetical protein BKA62DRAFT_678046 [Auriculariales sp. MPI-PUGE-AT-0066]